MNGKDGQDTGFGSLVQLSPIIQESIPWPHRFQVSEFVNKKAFVFVPPSDNAAMTTRIFVRAVGEQLGFEETADLADAVRIFCDVLK